MRSKRSVARHDEHDYERNQLSTERVRQRRACWPSMQHHELPYSSSSVDYVLLLMHVARRHLPNCLNKTQLLTNVVRTNCQSEQQVKRSKIVARNNIYTQIHILSVRISERFLPAQAVKISFSRFGTLTLVIFK